MTAISNVLGQIQKKNSSPDALDLLHDHFLSPGGILESSPYLLAKDGLTESEAQLLALIPNLTRYALRENFGAHPKLDNFITASQYLKTLYIGISVEQFHVLHLEENGRLIQCKMLQQGSVDETPFYIAHLLQDVIFSEAKAIVLSHNHPGGTPRPSKADVLSTISAIGALCSIGVPVVDHIIIADGKPVSLRGFTILNPNLWVQQDPSSALLRDWLTIIPDPF